MGRAIVRARAAGARRRTLFFTGFLLLGGVYLLPMRLGVVCGESMSPSLHDGQVFVMRRVGRRTALRRGDVVVFDLRGEKYVKRVYAVPGDTVSGLDWSETAGHPDYIADPSEMKVLPELARRRPAVGRFVRVTVPRDHVFVLGDAVTHSFDSRQFGPVPVDRISGRLIGTVFSVRRGAVYPRAMALEMENRPE